MKTLSNKLISIFIFSVIFFCISCKNQLNNYIQTEKATVTFSLSPAQERVIYPDYISDITEFENFELNYGLLGDAHEIIKEYDAIEKSTYENFITTKLEIEPGLYYFSLHVQKGSCYFSGTAETEIKQNEENCVSFILKNEKTDDETKGFIKAKFFFDLPEGDESDNLFTINITNMFDKNGEKILIPTEPTENEDGKKYINVNEKLNSGYYLVTVNFEINDYSDLEAAYPGISLRDTMSEAFYVCSGYETNYESELKTLNKVHSITYEHIEDSIFSKFEKYTAYNAKQVFTALSKNPPAKEDFILARWYVDEELKTPFENFLNSEGDVTLYASWKKKEAVTPSFKYQFQDSEGYTFSLEDKVIDGFRTEKIIAFPSAFFNLEILSVSFQDVNNPDNLPNEFPPDSGVYEGVYNVTVTAEAEKITLTTEVSNFIVSKDMKQPYVFTFSPDSSNSEENGKINLSFVDNSSYFNNYSAEASGLYITAHNTTTSWINDTVDPESYKAEFTFFDKEDETINSIKDVQVLVWPGFTTDAFFGPENLVNNENKLIIEASEEYKETHPVSPPVEPREIMVGSGYEFSTLTDAFNEIKKSGIGTYNLYVSGYEKLSEDLSSYTDFITGTYISIDFSECSFKTVPANFLREVGAVNKVKLPSSVETIESYAFQSTGLSEIDFGGTTKINNNAFEDCMFTSITIPSSVTYIQQNAFTECSMLDSVVIEGVIRTCGIEVFSKCSSLEKIHLSSNTAYALGTDMMTGCKTGHYFVVNSEELKNDFKELNPTYVFEVE